MFLKHGVDFDWSTLFDLKENKKHDLIKQLKQWKAEYEPEYFIYLLGFDEAQNKEAYIKACEIEVLGFCLNDSGFAKDVLNDDDYAKALNLFERKQYSSKLLKDLLSKFSALMQRYENKDGIRAYLERDIHRTAQAISDEIMEKSFAPLKKVIEKIASGVKSDCYFAAEKPYYPRGEIIGKVCGFLIEKYGYRLDEYALGDFLRLKNSYGSIFRSALLDDEEFWQAHENFNVIAFIGSVYKLNDERRAQKILSYIMDKVKGNSIGAKLIENNIPLTYIFEEEAFRNLKSSLLRFFYRFEGIYDLDKIKDEACCYPYTKCEGVEEKIASGKKIMDGLFASVYPADSQKVIDFFNCQINGEEPFKVYEYTTVKNLFIGYSSCLWYNTNERKAVLVYCPEYFSLENIWSRIYLIAYMASKLENNTDKCYANLFEIFYDLFKAAEKKFGLKTTYQKDNGGREKAYAELKKLLQNYGLTISDKFKNDYITALLDRKVAVMEEIERFPALEQLGDAVYGLAVAEMMFYQPAELESESIFKDYDNYICANAQVEISRKLGLDKLYISPLTLSYKYSRETFVDPDIELFIVRQESEDRDCKFKFLADSLEMVIGVICKDKGYQTAIDFTKRIVKEQFPEVFKKEIRYGSAFEFDFEIDSSYWNRIRPTPFLDCGGYEEYESRKWIEHMWDALNKFMLAYALGTDDKEVRKFITVRHSDAKNGDSLYGKMELGGFRANHAMYDYLHNGLAYMVDNYSAKIKENYKKLENK